MPSPGYVELHCHSGFSFLDGASHPEELVQRALELGYPALALTDHDGLHGAMEFAQAATLHGLQPITGVELTLSEVVPGLDLDTEPAWPARGHHVTLLAETPRGYANLSRLVTRTRLESPRDCPSLPLHHLLDDPERLEGIVCLTGCRRSPIWAALQSSQADGETMLDRFRQAFEPGRLFVELQDTHARGDTERGRRMGALADRVGLPVVATNDVHIHRPERHRLQDVLVAIRHRTTLDGSHALRRPNPCHALASAAEMAVRFHSRLDALTNTLVLADRCRAFDLTRNLGYAFPDFEGSQRGGALETLAAVCLAELSKRYEPGSSLEQAAEDRLHQELKLVDLHGLAGFFLVYRDIMNLAREVALEVRGEAPRARSGLPPGRGRGSSVSSIICYLIGLSHVDPVQADLFLGRFLNEALRTVPDIDLDFPRDIREELILRIYDRYGTEHAGLVCTFPTYRLRSAVREIGKALDLPFGDLEKLAKLAESRSATGLKAELERLPEFREKASAPLWQALGALAEEVAGLPRHVSQHVGGMIISSRPLVEIVPLEPAAMEGRILCQWDKDSCDDAGFIKIDFLALGMLSLVEDAVDLIAHREGLPPDLSRIDYRDQAVFDRICAGDTVGLFQVESRAQIQMIRRVRPRTLEDLAVQVAIVRPGPIVGGAVNPYVRRREMLLDDPDFIVPYDHPLLEEALGETLGVIIFQDQVLKVCQALAGFSDGQAEELRRAMSRKRSLEAMRSHWEAFRDGAAERGVDEMTARKVFKQVSAFSEFGFPKSHAAAFGLLAYQSAWLRHYHPVEYYVALFNNQPMGFYSLDALGRDARRNGLRILLPDVNRSRVECTAEGDDLRVGLGFVRGLGTEMAERIVTERERRGPFPSLLDFLRRTPALLKRPAIENLVWVGAFDGVGLTRRELLWHVGLWLGPESDARRTGGRDDHPQQELPLDDPYADLRFGGLDDADRLVAEYRMLRFSTRLHPLSLLQDQLPPDTVGSDRFPDIPDRSMVRVAGLVTARQRPSTAKGYVFVLMEDEHGAINVILKPDIYEEFRSDVRLEPFLVVRGRLQKDGATMNVIATEVRALRAGSHSGLDDPELQPALPETLEYWAAGARHLTALRQNSPGSKSWG
ncbi:MAG: DNA polymerase III subunit alpha [Gemmatimonadetes bacterium]|nr:DNA polymerase III subunit alpha [Gemmatimonadota bacterium]